MIDKIYKLMDAFSLSGAIILIFATLTGAGIVMKNERVWQTFATALTTFCTGKKIGEANKSNELPK